MTKTRVALPAATGRSWKKRDQQIGTQAGDFPTDEGQHRVTAGHQQRHRRREQTQNQEKAMETGFSMQVVH
ncbi:hypothetical protein E4P82_04480 [Candidatus Competibacter phosphatis]|uniref:Uncharacterized protein n=1 Tax=Candidatus Competibacter phosphatis TaxID=221280 RepID=A0ABX1TGM6_9GAMM|nr:hypothetical protein [Candidatus Competibacter phosphatis]NMQ18517.1 hypothetical protein [Candidatus Competibacter phosphatis]